MSALVLDGSGPLSRVAGVDEYGEVGDGVLWAPQRRPLHVAGTVSVLWAMLEAPGSIDEITDLIVDEHGLERAPVSATVREAALMLWGAGLIDIGSNDRPELPSATALPPNH